MPPGYSSAEFRLYSRGGSDQIARDLFRFGWHGFELPVPDVFAACVRAFDGLVLDVGANTGFYTLVALTASPAASVHAFEPYPPVAHCLDENLRLNDAGDRVRLWLRAVSDHEGQAVLYVPDPGHGLVETSCSLNPEFKERVVDEVPVDVVTLDGHLDALGRPPVTVVKIDVESLEHRVLAGARELLAGDRPIVFLEVLPSGDPGAIDRIRERHDYVVVRLRPEVAVVGGRVEFDPDGWNQVLVPSEKLDAVGEVLAGVPLVTVPAGTAV
jgi:FkbM family methyltransferase